MDMAWRTAPFGVRLLSGHADADAVVDDQRARQLGAGVVEGRVELQVGRLLDRAARGGARTGWFHPAKEERVVVDGDGLTGVGILLRAR